MLGKMEEAAPRGFVWGVIVGAMWIWGAQCCGDFGWMVAFGPFQICYYRLA